ncbi:short-chain dehydrogenase/reductase SDR [Pseudomonas sp. M47T1]|uniref:SDR family oxidoreductase n=1 Tax=Pseudomonas sp. M47T1 TaxID=1179778 RepID=UPI000260732A|nr:SDR family oxidoreductase [Pseudomonas sp. M47T1]EIK94400.1 short-chain dehydrogenase/reductase SDR [Pseudomonas sp. M47T1]
MSRPTYEFSGQVALITGASQGLGFATAKAFAESGASVVLSDSNADSLQQATEQLKDLGFSVLAVPCDVTQEAQVKALIEKTVAAFGRLDMAFNNAGVSGPTGAITEETEEGFDQVNSVNLKGVWACMKHELIQMEKQGFGAIVNCSSLGGLVGLPGRTAYHGTKHGVLGITKCAALEFATKNIRVNAVCPGTFDTPMVEDIDQDSITEFMRSQPIGRMGRPEELAAAVLWLSSSAASFVIGAALCVDGGFTTH